MASRDPEILLASTRRELDYRVEPSRLPRLIAQVNRSVPSYESPYLLATYYASRKDAPEKVNLGFEIAIRRYPTNGRLRLAFAQWLSVASEDLGAWKAVEKHSGATPTELSERQLARALELEPSLLGSALLHFGGKFTPEVWTRVSGSDTASVEVLVAHFNQIGEMDSARRLLESMVRDSDDVGLLQRSIAYADQWKDLEWGLELASRWQEAAAPSESDAAQLAVARYKLSLGRQEEITAELSQRVSALEASGAHTYQIAEMLCRVGDLFLNEREFTRAEGLFGDALLRAPNHIPCSLSIARLYEQSGDTGLANEEYRRVLTLEPANSEARRALERLVGVR